MVKKDLVNKYDLKDFQNFTLKKKINYFKFLERLIRNNKDSIFYQDNSLDKKEIKFLLLNSNSSKINLIFTYSNDRKKDIFKLTLEIEKNNKVKKKIVNTTFKKVLKLSRLLGMESLFLTTVLISVLMTESKNILLYKDDIKITGEQYELLSEEEKEAFTGRLGGCGCTLSYIDSVYCWGRCDCYGTTTDIFFDCVPDLGCCQKDCGFCDDQSIDDCNCGGTPAPAPEPEPEPDPDPPPGYICDSLMGVAPQAQYFWAPIYYNICYPA